LLGSDLGLRRDDYWIEIERMIEIDGERIPGSTGLLLPVERVSGLVFGEFGRPSIPDLNRGCGVNRCAHEISNNETIVLCGKFDV